MQFSVRPKIAPRQKKKQKQRSPLSRKKQKQNKKKTQTQNKTENLFVWIIEVSNQTWLTNETMFNLDEYWINLI